MSKGLSDEADENGATKEEDRDSEEDCTEKTTKTEDRIEGLFT